MSATEVVTCPECGYQAHVGAYDDVKGVRCPACFSELQVARAASGVMVHVRPVKYEVSVIPPAMRDKPRSEAYHWTLTVEYRRDGWGVFCDSGTYCLRRDGRRWAWPANARGRGRGQRWINAYRMPLEEALALAVKHAPKIRVGRFNHTAMDFIVRETAREIEAENANKDD